MQVAPICRACKPHRLLIVLALFLALLPVSSTNTGWAARDGAQGASAQRLQITSLDQSRFPELGVNLILTDGQSQPLSNLQGLRLRENGVPIADYDVRQVTVGLDLIFVIEGDERLLQSEGDGSMTPLQRIQDTILFYSGRFMDVAGRDHVSVIVPGAAGGQVLAQDVTDPEALIEAVRGYEPREIPGASGVDMLQQALDLAEATQAGRFQAIVLLSDTRGLNSALFEPVVERAQALQVPIFGLLLVPAQNEEAAETMSGLTAPTRGSQAAVPTPTDSSDLFQLVQNNAAQTQLRYQSNLRQSGTYAIEATMGGVDDEATLYLELAPPEASIELAQTQIRRTGTQIDSPLPELQPSVQPVPVQIVWPDGLPRRLDAATLLANGEVQDAPFVGGVQSLLFDWNIADVDAGDYALTVQITDTLGMGSQSQPVSVAVEVVRPQPLPTATPTPTPEPFAFVSDLAPQLESGDLFSPPVVGAIALLLLLVFLAGRQIFVPEDGGSEPGRELAEEGARPATGSALASNPALSARLEPMEGGLEPITVSASGATLGRSATEVDIALDDSSISPLHASIQRRGDSFWLYDEGSEMGTLLNYKRLGLAPRALADGDEIQLGRVRMRFRLVRSEQPPDTNQDSEDT